MLTIIAAVAKNNVIGKDNKLLWHIPEDLRRFKKLTEGHTIIMGRKTFEALGKLLPNRKHIILSASGQIKTEHNDIEIVKDIDMLDKYINSDEECFVIGGGMIYNVLIPYTNKMYITKVKHEYEGDTHFPKIDMKDWQIIDIEKGLKDDENPYDYEYITYIRK